MSWLKNRLKEPSTFAGIGQIVGGVAVVANSGALAQVADAVGQGGQVIAGGAPVAGYTLILSGLLAALLKEKAR